MLQERACTSVRSSCAPAAWQASRFSAPDRMAQALDNDQEGATVQHRKLFEEDREFNQGARPAPPATPGFLSLAGGCACGRPPGHPCCPSVVTVVETIEICLEGIHRSAWPWTQNPVASRTCHPGSIPTAHSSLVATTPICALPRPGEFAEALRDQFMAEHSAYYVELEEALMEATGFEADCSREHLVAALAQLNPDLPEKQVGAQGGRFLGNRDSMQAVQTPPLARVCYCAGLVAATPPSLGSGTGKSQRTLSPVSSEWQLLSTAVAFTWWCMQR